MEIEFSWDEHKAEINLKKHGVTFEDAVLVFYDAYTIKIALKMVNIAGKR